ncbi:VOC family protein [Nocardia crassostreae]|uniref:VOC family protein n=1 Tax=Nocardia crassostreae TaxID=53428 RepID=UPI00083403E8|nr:VOC family protein [Nocardia crassostreae]
MIERIHPYIAVDDPEASAEFYSSVFGLEIAMRNPVLGLRAPGNPAAQVIVLPPRTETPTPRFGIDLGDPPLVDAAYTEAVRRGAKIVYPLTDELWGVRRFFVEDPDGTVVNVLAHKH